MNSLYSYTYILECANGQYYVGSTTDLERRLQEHQAGLGARFTKKHLPVRLVYCEEYQSVEQAFYRERQLHGWSRAKKEALIKGEFERLPELSASRTSATDSSKKNVPSTSSGTVTVGEPVLSTVGEPVLSTVGEPVEPET
jgi:putative endonuclease